MKVVLDCNVLISAGLNPGTCREVMTAVIRLHQPILSKAILREYVVVAERRHFARAAAVLFDLIKILSRNALFVTPEPASSRLPDPKDPDLFGYGHRRPSRRADHR